MKTSALIAVFTGLAMAGTVVTADETNDSASASSARITTTLRFSQDVQEQQLSLQVPFLKNSKNIVALDLRGGLFDNSEEEVNAGLVFRHLLDNEALIVGANVYYDGRWTEDNYFSQVGAGVELLSRWVDLRANYYHPLDDAQETESFTETTTYVTNVPHQRITTTTVSSYSVFEEALDGYDVELGGWIPYLSDVIPTALFVGYYQFSSDYVNDIDGIKIRLESRVLPNLTLDAEWFDESELNGTDYFVGFRIHIPVDFWNKRSWGRNGKDLNRSLAARMNDMVMRDLRIRTINTGNILTGQTQSQTIQPTSGPAPAPELPQENPGGDPFFRFPAGSSVWTDVTPLDSF